MGERQGIEIARPAKLKRISSHDAVRSTAPPIDVRVECSLQECRR
jgi:hypothetical protein